MSKEKQRVSYFIVCIRDFGAKFGLESREAFAYLDKYKGMRFLSDCYEAEHTLSIEDAVADMTAVCRRNGGQLS